jgi:predicted small lipoprotein YifL
MKHKVFSVILISAVLGISMFLSGCGKKGPPVPPRQVVLPAVNDLESVLEDDRVILTWTVPETKEKKGPFISGFVVHKAKNPVQESECKNCPVKYNAVAEIMAGSEGKSGKMKYAGQLEKGFKYFFKVTAFGEKTASGSKDSNIVEFIY